MEGVVVVAAVAVGEVVAVVVLTPRLLVKDTQAIRMSLTICVYPNMLVMQT